MLEKRADLMATTFEHGSGNVFADIGIPDPETHRLKAQLSIIIGDEIRRRGLSQREAAATIGVTQSDVSHIARGVLRGFSLERLIRCVRALGVDVTLQPSAPDTQYTAEPIVLGEAEASAHDVAAYILDKLRDVTGLKIQKLVYYCQAWSLAWFQRPLFPERVEAWQHGPVVPDIYTFHQGQRPLPHPWPTGDPSKLSAVARETIDAVLDRYGSKSANELRKMTHDEEPWKIARGDLPDDAPSNNEISHASMARYYRNQ